MNALMTMSPNWRAFFVLMFYLAVFILVDLYPNYRIHIFMIASIFVSLYISYAARMIVFDRERSRQRAKTMIIDRNGNRMYISTL
jgi:capsule polysaccharide modification protein KpsS